ncbi:MAG: MBOAT family protein [Alphaproteobacteria bacterium]|nr:MBOAT family protein [Alphaproteobacteria bacterium]MBU2082840.1 MBOAT family protein [Alphaproteobacteria bacterium]MBU2142976.1 MBOAT family protein [Alphaproteobacteria bacterium]MBU2196570.1 MBOAT family protein [Alphaproteobacteria bacterium]
MVFSEPIFLFMFLPLSLAVILALTGRGHSLAILVFSLVFYYWTSGLLTLLLAGSIFFNWFVGLRLDQCRNKRWLQFGIAMNVLVLGTFKYAIFFASNIDGIFGSALSPHLRWIILPIGISFYTFQCISYLMDIWRRDAEPENNLIVFGAYLSFFPQLIAGPIVRFKTVIADYHAPKVSLENATAGAARFSHGLFKKVVVADSSGIIADACFALSAGDLTTGAAWLGALAYTVQIYFDFSAYSDMAIGLASVCGIRMDENFNRPYTSSTLTEFWRRWHISLSTWFRDYLYIPLGGNRKGQFATYRNLIVVFFVTGLWHGAAWTFVLWGLYHGAFLILERVTLGRAAGAIEARFARFVYLLPVVIFGWVLFRAESLQQALEFYQAMLVLSVPINWSLAETVTASTSPLILFGFYIGLLSLFAPKHAPLGVQLTQVRTLAGAMARFGYAGIVLIVGAVYALSSDFSPFLYFRF